MSEPFLFRKRDGSVFTINRPAWAVSSTIRETGLIELLCKHGTGHPAPESVAWLDEHGPRGSRGAWVIHGCCGCCLDLDRKYRDLAARQAAAANEEDFDGGED